MGSDLKGCLQKAEGGGIMGGGGGNHWKQTKGVPGTQKVNQEISPFSRSTSFFQFSKALGFGLICGHKYILPVECLYSTGTYTYNP